MLLKTSCHSATESEEDLEPFPSIYHYILAMTFPDE